MANATFNKKTLTFLEELEANNNRDWFQANKDRYEQTVMEPAFAFISSIGEQLPKVSPHFVAMPKKSGGSLMRVYRDTRFSKDKTPYKTNIGIQFRHERGKDVHAPGFYVHFDKNECFLGVGLWRPDRDALAAIRQAIDEKGSQWKRVRDGAAFRAVYELGGDSLKRPPKGYADDHRFIDDLKRKDHIAVKTLKTSAAARASFADDIGEMFVASKPYMKFLCEAMGLEF